MALEIIGAGFGRTGTLSLKQALETLGLGRCYHMMEVFGAPEHVGLWAEAAEGKPVDWNQLFADYRATVDWPACTFWRELADHYPEAKILLSLRDADRWYDSVAETIYQGMTRPLPDSAPELAKQHRQMVHRLILEGTFSGRFEERSHAIEVYEQHNQQVRDAFGPERLLVYEVAQGWAPLCRFFDVAVPEDEFPHVNDRASFRARMGLEPRPS